jgi:hypothetical protein
MFWGTTGLAVTGALFALGVAGPRLCAAPYAIVARFLSAFVSPCLPFLQLAGGLWGLTRVGASS